ncbi:hypothetical protein C9374_003145 [Naegleria lovaniensis]|uniref:Wiskott-Aldrich syndrome protein family member n=1 Tax=Naegleria lovaniensis TaxID=51637 RepID=A0AA88GPL4_NAELO|nr:uncharacterized protein C9374_003145 [Naegleria lovaniensis]KAG2385996.1 hypothetical protein C9374_003145 [Naegleria lovaniensis]
MVLTQVRIGHFDQPSSTSTKPLYGCIESSRISGQILHGRNMNSMTGVMQQLSTLALTACEMFQSLSQTVQGSFERIHSLNSRIQEINHKMPEYEQFMHQNNHKLLFRTSCHELSESSLEILYRKDVAHISKDNSPVPLHSQYANNCLEAYSNSKLFFNEWAKREFERHLKAKRKREERRKQAPLAHSNATHRNLRACPPSRRLAQVRQLRIYRHKFNSEGQIMPIMAARHVATTIENIQSTENVAVSHVSEVPTLKHEKTHVSEFPPTVRSIQVEDAPQAIRVESPYMNDVPASYSTLVEVPNFNERSDTIPSSSGIIPPPPSVISLEMNAGLLKTSVESNKSQMSRLAVTAGCVSWLEDIKQGKSLKPADARS